MPVTVKGTDPSELKVHWCHCKGCNSILQSELPHTPGNFGIHIKGHHKLRVFKRERAETTVMLSPGQPAAERTFIDVEEDISNTCWQVATGPNGAAWRYSEPKHRCRRCDREVCAYVDNGDFHVESKDE